MTDSGGTTCKTLLVIWFWHKTYWSLVKLTSLQFWWEVSPCIDSLDRLPGLIIRTVGMSKLVLRFFVLFGETISVGLVCFRFVIFLEPFTAKVLGAIYRTCSLDISWTDINLRCSHFLQWFCECFHRVRNKKKMLDLVSFVEQSEPWARHRREYFPFSLSISLEIATQFLT